LPVLERSTPDSSRDRSASVRVTSRSAAPACRRSGWSDRVCFLSALNAKRFRRPAAPASGEEARRRDPPPVTSDHLLHRISSTPKDGDVPAGPRTSGLETGHAGPGGEFCPLLQFKIPAPITGTKGDYFGLDDVDVIGDGSVAFDGVLRTAAQMIPRSMCSIFTFPAPALLGGIGEGLGQAVRILPQDKGQPCFRKQRTSCDEDRPVSVSRRRSRKSPDPRRAEQSRSPALERAERELCPPLGLGGGMTLLLGRDFSTSDSARQGVDFATRDCLRKPASFWTDEKNEHKNDRAFVVCVSKFSQSAEALKVFLKSARTRKSKSKSKSKSQAEALPTSEARAGEPCSVSPSGVPRAANNAPITEGQLKTGLSVSLSCPLSAAASDDRSTIGMGMGVDWTYFQTSNKLHENCSTRMASPTADRSKPRPRHHDLSHWQLASQSWAAPIHLGALESSAAILEIRIRCLTSPHVSSHAAPPACPPERDEESNYPARPPRQGSCKFQDGSFRSEISASPPGLKHSRVVSRHVREEVPRKTTSSVMTRQQVQYFCFDLQPRAKRHTEQKAQYLGYSGASAQVIASREPTHTPSDDCHRPLHSDASCWARTVSCLQSWKADTVRELVPGGKSVRLAVCPVSVIRKWLLALGSVRRELRLSFTKVTLGKPDVLCGLALYAVAIWVATDGYRLYPLSAVSGKDDIFAGSWIAIFTGFAFFCTAVYGVFAAVRESRAMMLLYLVLMLVIYIFEAASAITAATHRDYLVGNSNLIKKQMLTYYADDSDPGRQVTTTWNRVMLEVNCCGTDGPLDWISYNSTFRSKFPTQEYPWPLNCCKRKDNFEVLNLDACRIGDWNYMNYKVGATFGCFARLGPGMKEAEGLGQWFPILVLVTHTPAGVQPIPPS
ncbi:UPK1A protein, partial [Atractosteus spatula]|nr:UPK1A protein [Atractosteus spatula]